MTMTKKEIILKKWLIKTLKSQGYKTYAQILNELDVRIDERPYITAYMNPQTGEIALGAHVIGETRQQFEKVASVLTRHEILHGFLQHEQRMMKKLEAKHKNDKDGILDNLDEKSLKDILRNEIYNDPKYKDLNGDNYFNIAGDYEISNRGYTAADKEVIRNINLNGQIVSGLVTEDMDPSWVNLPLEELFDKVKEKCDRDKKDVQKLADAMKNMPVVGAFVDDTTFVDINGVSYGVE